LEQLRQSQENQGGQISQKNKNRGTISKRTLNNW